MEVYALWLPGSLGKSSKANVSSPCLIFKSYHQIVAESKPWTIDVLFRARTPESKTNDPKQFCGLNTARSKIDAVNPELREP